MKKNLRRTTALFLTAVCVFFCCSPAFASNTLVYSELYSIPSNYDSYNCYGYAIGENENVDPGYYTNSPLGQNGDDIEIDVIADLVALGHYNLCSVSASYSLRPGERMIAFAYGWWSQIENIHPNDRSNRGGEGSNYHFWRKDSNGGYWYHKFGPSSAIMRLKSGYNPSNIEVTDEYYSGTGIISPALTQLISPTIHYIAFTPNTSINSMP